MRVMVCLKTEQNQDNARFFFPVPGNPDSTQTKLEIQIQILFCVGLTWRKDSTPAQNTKFVCFTMGPTWENYYLNQIIVFNIFL